MPNTRRVIALLAAVSLAATSCKPGDKSSAGPSAGGGSPSDDRIPAGGQLPAANALSAARPSNPSPDAGGALFGSMNCDGCHGGGAVGWVGPSLVDGRWRYGGTDEDIFTSIYYGRPKGMPAYGGVIGTDGVWMLVAYIKSQGVPNIVPTTNFEPGGNASANPPAAPAAAAAAPAAPAKVSPEEVPAKYGCTACHAVDHKVVGPAFKDVAAKYKGQADAEAKLVNKISKGEGHPKTKASPEDAKGLIKWVLSQ